MNTIAQVSTPSTFGVSIDSEGNIETFCTGQFDAGHAEAIAQKLILLASSIRSTARQHLVESGQ